jgi:hypothetical protein
VKIAYRAEKTPPTILTVSFLKGVPYQTRMLPFGVCSKITLDPAIRAHLRSAAADSSLRRT